MYTKNFEYDNEKLSDYGMIVCSFNGSGGMETVSCGSDITFLQEKAGGANRFLLYSTAYDSAFSAVFHICKDPALIQKNSDMYFTTTEISALQKWLCQKQYRKFKIDQDDYRHFYWNAVFSVKQINFNGSVIGMELTLYTDAPFCYMDEIVIEKECREDTLFEIYDSSDEEGYLFPDLRIKFLENGRDIAGPDGSVKYQKAFTLTNTQDRHSCIIQNCSANEVITINGKSQMISSSVPGHCLGADFNFFFPKIINSYKDNKNIFSCNINCLLTLSYSPIRKIGL